MRYIFSIVTPLPCRPCMCLVILVVQHSHTQAIFFAFVHSCPPCYPGQLFIFCLTGYITFRMVVLTLGRKKY